MYNNENDVIHKCAKNCIIENDVIQKCAKVHNIGNDGIHKWDKKWTTSKTLVHTNKPKSVKNQKRCYTQMGQKCVTSKMMLYTNGPMDHYGPKSV